MKRQLVNASRPLSALTTPPSPSSNTTCSKTGTATGSSPRHGFLGLTATAVGAGACLLMGMCHEKQKHRSHHFCEAHSNYDGEEEYDEKEEEYWESQAHFDGETLASSHYEKNTLLSNTPFLGWLEEMRGRTEEQKENADPLKKTTNKFVDPSIPIPVSLEGPGGPGVLDLMVGQTTGKAKEAVRRTGSDTSTGATDTLDVSVRALKGNRLSMEDEYCIRNKGRFAAVFDGHGGGGVSTYLRQKLYDLIQSHMRQSNNQSSLEKTVSSIRKAFEQIDQEVLETDKLQYQGSTAVAVYLHHDETTGQQTLISANVGDSRAILSKSGVAIDLTRDHKPDDLLERRRITDMGEEIEWDDYSGVFRVRNLSLSRAIGDRFAKPVVSGEVEIKLFPLEEELINERGAIGNSMNGSNDFVLLASDGLWDVMTSQDCVDLVHKRLSPSSAQLRNMSPIEVQRQMHTRRKNMSRYLGNEALRRGSGDNVCVIIIWLNSQQ